MEGLRSRRNLGVGRFISRRGARLGLKAGQRFGRAERLLVAAAQRVAKGLQSALLPRPGDGEGDAR